MSDTARFLRGITRMLRADPGTAWAESQRPYWLARQRQEAAFLIGWLA